MNRWNVSQCNTFLLLRFRCTDIDFADYKPSFQKHITVKAHASHGSGGQLEKAILSHWRLIHASVANWWAVEWFLAFSGNQRNRNHPSLKRVVSCDSHLTPPCPLIARNHSFYIYFILHDHPECATSFSAFFLGNLYLIKWHWWVWKHGDFMVIASTPDKAVRSWALSVPGALCGVLGQSTLLSHCSSPPGEFSSERPGRGVTLRWTIPIQG